MRQAEREVGNESKSPQTHEVRVARRLLAVSRMPERTVGATKIRRASGFLPQDRGTFQVLFRNSLLTACLGAGLLLVSAKPAYAQYFHTYNSPLSRQMVSPYANRPAAVTPYINLIGRNPVINYFGIVRPELEMRSLQTQQIQAIQTLGRQLQGAEPKAPDQWSLPKTGHRSYFMNFSHYYPSRQ